MGLTLTRNQSANKKQPEKTTVFRSEPGVVYRIPALIYLNDIHTYLAFAEKGISESDNDANCLVMRKGTSQNGEIQWSPVEEVKSASLPGYRTMNPCPVYERKTNTLFLFFICVLGKNKAHLCYVTSSDDGQTWSETRDLTESVIGETTNRWATFAVGPGHGIQLESGRLVIPAYAYMHNSPPVTSCLREANSFSIHSDDSGHTWNIGEKLQHESPECDMPLLAPELAEMCNGCQGSMIDFSAPNDEAHSVGDTSSPVSTGSQTWLLYTHSTDETSRVDMGVYLNRTPLKASGWSRPWIIHSGPSGYSDLAYNEDMENFACLMECGKGNDLEEIAIVSFTINDVLQAEDMKDKKCCYCCCCCCCCWWDSKNGCCSCKCK